MLKRLFPEECIYPPRGFAYILISELKIQQESGDIAFGGIFKIGLAKSWSDGQSLGGLEDGTQQEIMLNITFAINIFVKLISPCEDVQSGPKAVIQIGGDQLPGYTFVGLEALNFSTNP